MQVPRITKITINMGVGEAVADKKVMDAAVADLTKITGQKPLITKSRKADRVLQAARGPRHRRQGDAARRAHVRVPRPPDQHRDAAHPRLPRRARRAPSTARATTAWASRNRSFSPRSSTTRSTRSAAWTSRLLRRRPMTVTAEHCSRHSTSRSGSNRNHKVYGEDEHGRARKTSRRDREKVRGEAREAQGADQQPQDLARAARWLRRRSCRRSRATPARRGSAIAVPSRAARAACTASSACRG